MPDLLHIIPVGDDTVFNGVFQGEDTSLGLSFITNIGILLAHTDHDTLVTGTANDGGEDSPGASSPAKPALHMPEPLSQTRAATSSSHILGVLNLFVGGYLSTQLGGLRLTRASSAFSASPG